MGRPRGSKNSQLKNSLENYKNRSDRKEGIVFGKSVCFSNTENGTNSRNYLEWNIEGVSIALWYVSKKPSLRSKFTTFALDFQQCN